MVGYERGPLFFDWIATTSGAHISICIREIHRRRHASGLHRKKGFVPEGDEFADLTREASARYL